MKRVSIDNGHSFVTAGEALSAIRLNAMIPYMDDEAREAAHNEVAPCSEKMFLEKYLELATDDLIIG
jgi:hypothetical protein